MILGFTGTQRALTDKQIMSVAQYLDEHRAEISHVVHGGCIGADDEFDKLAISQNLRRIVYPSTIKPKSIPNEVLLNRGPVTIYRPKPPLERNKIIVKYVGILLACPKEAQEVLRSGTWATIRYARKAGTKVEVIYP